MSRIKVNRPEPVPTTYTLTLSEQEAMLLAGLLGRVSSVKDRNDNNIDSISSFNLWSELVGALGYENSSAFSRVSDLDDRSPSLKVVLTK